MKPPPVALIRLGLAFLAAAAPAAAVAAELTLESAVATALARNPALAAVEELRAQVVGGIREARADAFPQLAAVSSWGKSRSPAFLNSPDFEDILEQFPGGTFEPSTQELYRAVLEVTQPIYTFGKVGAAIDLAKIVADTADAQIATARLDTARDAAEAYYGVLAAREGLRTVEVERDFRARDLERIASLLEIGEATELQELRARAALAEVEPEVARRRGAVAVAETGLRRVLALAAGEPVEVTPASRALPEPPSRAQLVESALGGRPELRDLALQERVYERRQVVTRAEGKPQIDFTGSWGREVRLIESFDDPLYSAWSFGVGMRWEFFDGGRRSGQVAQLESQRQQIALRRRDLESGIALEVDRTLSDYQTARARSRAADLSASVAREAVRVARATFEEGVATQTDLLDAQSRAAAADVLAVEAFYEALVQAARLARAVGAMPTTGWAPSTEN
jgi:HAE1 family hydrophobic/amphiphilic exporter-1